MSGKKFDSWEDNKPVITLILVSIVFVIYYSLRVSSYSY